MKRSPCSSGGENLTASHDVLEADIERGISVGGEDRP